MKKVTSLVFFCALLFYLGISVSATSNTYDLDELGLQVTIPSGYSVITRATPANDPIFSELGTTKSALIAQFEASNIHLNAISETYSEEIVVTMMENALSNFSLLNDSTLEVLASTWIAQYANYGIQVSKHEIYHHSQAKFIKIYFTDTAKTVHGLQYYTIYDGKAMNFTMRSYEGSLLPRQEDTIKIVVDSIMYDNDPPISTPNEDTDAFIYKDSTCELSFTVPANWKQTAFSQDREFIDAKFVSTTDSDCAIIYSSVDIWTQLSAADKVGYTRSDLDNSAFTKADIASMYNTSADNITTVTYNGIQYFKGEPKYTSDSYGIDISIPMTQLVYIKNGWMYTFQFSGTDTHKLYSEFESLVKSVKYPSTSSNIESGSSNSSLVESPNSNNPNGNSGIIAVFVLLIFMAALAVIIVRSRHTKADVVSFSQDYAVSVPHPTKAPGHTVHCKNCGQSVPLESAFCHKCGSKIFKEDNTQ